MIIFLFTDFPTPAGLKGRGGNNELFLKIDLWVDIKVQIKIGGGMKIPDTGL